MSQIVNSIKEFLVSVTREKPKLDESHAIFQNLPQLPAQFTIEVADTERELLKLKTAKATGPDKIPACVLKDFAHILAGPLTAVFNSSIRQGIVSGLEIILCGTSPNTAAFKAHCQGPAPYLSDANCWQYDGPNVTHTPIPSQRM